MSNKKITLSSPKFRVVLGDPNDPNDEDAWQEVEVQSMTRDIAAAEQLFRQRKWGPTTEQGIRMMAVTAWQALRRNHLIDATTSWERFEASYVDLEAVEDDDAEEGPTPPAPEAG
jgi:hypothetical protein